MCGESFGIGTIQKRDCYLTLGNSLGIGIDLLVGLREVYRPRIHDDGLGDGGYLVG